MCPNGLDRAVEIQDHEQVALQGTLERDGGMPDDGAAGHAAAVRSDDASWAGKIQFSDEL